jgi:beta-1,4-mannosyltransferase
VIVGEQWSSDAVAPTQAGRLRAPARRVTIASFPPPIPQNPYQRLLYESLAEEDVVLVDSSPLRLGWLLRRRRSVDVLHFHWPEIYYRHRGAASPSAVVLSWLRLALFALRLGAARLLGYSIVWTVHQVSPHESPSPLLDRIGTTLLARSAHLLTANDSWTAAAAAARFGLRRAPAVVPHGSYIGVYPPGRDRSEVRRELGIDEDALVFLSLGNLRKYKGLDLLLAAFGGTVESLPNAVLVVAGLAIDGSEAEAIEAAAAADPRIRPLLGFVPDDRVAELFGAADAAILARTDGGTSGALVLALSQGVPPIASALPTYAALVSSTGAGWLFEHGNPDALEDALLRVASESSAKRAARAAAARAQAETMDWRDSSHALAALIRETRR